MSNLPATTPPVTPVPNSYDLRLEFEKVNEKLRKHHSKEELLDAVEYRKALNRSIEIIAALNQTTAGPGSTPKKKIAAAKKSGPVSLMDL